ncbi:MAG: hemerythrin domain-containing protein [Burkholderiales bacterium]|nr:hemerythrin domain-containing protein [Burkholderiales bacterium]
MTILQWTPALALGDARIDSTHQEFVDCVNAVGSAADGDMLMTIDALIAHTQIHFEQEQRWMMATKFGPAHCHQDEHDGVLEVMRATRGFVSEGKFHVGRVLATELGTWFQGHAATMDAMLARWLEAQGFDTSRELTETES